MQRGSKNQSCFKKGFETRRKSFLTLEQLGSKLEEIFSVAVLLILRFTGNHHVIACDKVRRTAAEANCPPFGGLGLELHNLQYRTPAESSVLRVY
jgi:hypothetical protein